MNPTQTISLKYLDFTALSLHRFYCINVRRILKPVLNLFLKAISIFAFLEANGARQYDASNQGPFSMCVQWLPTQFTHPKSISKAHSLILFFSLWVKGTLGIFKMGWGCWGFFIFHRTVTCLRFSTLITPFRPSSLSSWTIWMTNLHKFIRKTAGYD